jgi:hypothetical protein
VTARRSPPLWSVEINRKALSVLPEDPASPTSDLLHSGSAPIIGLHPPAFGNTIRQTSYAVGTLREGACTGRAGGLQGVFEEFAISLTAPGGGRPSDSEMQGSHPGRNRTSGLRKQQTGRKGGRLKRLSESRARSFDTPRSYRPWSSTVEAPVDLQVEETC